MAKIEDKNFYVGVTPYEHEGATYDVLNVTAGYRKGRGFYANIHAGWNTDWGGYGCTFDFSGNPLTDTIWVDVKDSPKNSQKTIDVMAAALQQAKDDIAYLFNERDWEHLKHLMKSVALYGYTASTCEFMKNVKKVQVEDLQVIDENNNEPKSEETMAKTMTAQDYVGKTVSIKGSDAKYVIKSVEGDKLMTDFYRAKDAQPMPCPLPWATLESKLKEGVYIVEGATATAADEVEEVDEIKVEGPKAAPKAETIDMKPKQSKPKATKPKADGKLTYSTYTNKKGKTCARILGFGENDPAYVNAADLHGSATYERRKDGGKTVYLIFGPRYADAAKEVCDALNAGKALKDCQAIIDKATEERARQRDEWKQKREERKAAKEDEPKGKTYTEAEVADLIKRVVAGDAETMRIVNELNKAA